MEAKVGLGKRVVGVPDRRLVEETLCQIPGVLSARVLGDDGEFAEVHVLAESGRHPKQVARDIETCLAAKFGVDLDYRRISVAQMEPVEPPDVRLRLGGVTLRLKDRVVEVDVELHLGERAFVGKASGPASARHRLLLTAEATARAVEEAIGSAFSVIVEGAATLHVSGRPAVVVVLTVADYRGEEAHSGTAYIRRDESEAAVRATLAALNRRLGLLLEDAV